MKTMLLFFVSIVIINAVPSEFDLRVQYSLLKYADYNLYPQGICSSYAWAKELAQVVSNAVSLQTQEKMSFSAQQILECTKFRNDPCHSSTLDNIHLALNQISKNGLTINDCYINKPLQYPGDRCKSTCQNGDPFDFIFRPQFKKHTNVMDIFDLLKKSQKVSTFAIIKLDNSLNLYSSFDPKLSNQNSEVYEYRIAQVLGWKKKQTVIILRLGPGTLWGYNGYIDLELQTYGKKYIQQFYEVVLPNQANLKIQQQ